MNDKFNTCHHCGALDCYETQVKNFKSWVCMSCGFNTNTSLINSSDFQKKHEETLPELYKDLKFIDSLNRTWYPTVLNFPEKGIVFANGTSKNQWGWSAMLATEVKEEEKEKFKKPETTDEYFKFKMDPSTMKNFDKENFYNAMEYIKCFEK